MRRVLLLFLMAGLAGCAGAPTAEGRHGARLVIAYGGDGRGAIGPCG